MSHEWRRRPFLPSLRLVPAHHGNPPEWHLKRILLHLGAVDYRATVWVNGTAVAWHEGGHTPFTCDITDAVLPGSNLLVVRAEDPPTDRYIPRGKQHWESTPASIFYARTTGIWQTVWLEPVPPRHLESIGLPPPLTVSSRSL